MSKYSKISLLLAACAIVAFAACAPAANEAPPAAPAAETTAAETAAPEAAPVAAPATIKISVGGMTCTGCESSIKQAVGAMPGVSAVNASHTEGSAEVGYDPALISPEAIRAEIEKLGYTTADAAAPAEAAPAADTTTSQG